MPASRNSLPLVLVSVVVVLVVLGLSCGFWLSNLHNGLLAVAFTLVGAYVLFQRPGHREGRLLLATGVVEAVMFFGRQVGHQDPLGAPWSAWLGVWPLVIALALTTLSVICFPDGGLPTSRWRPVLLLIVVLTAVCATLSALWPVEYAAAGIEATHPINPVAPAAATAVWSALAHPTYISFQVLWVVAVASRWRTASGHVRYQLAAVVLASAVSMVTLVLGLLVWGTPVPGVLSVTLLPLAAGWAIVHGQHLNAYAALSWLSRTGPESDDLASDIAQAVAKALDAPGAVLWMGTPDSLHAVGVFPESLDAVGPTTLLALNESARVHARPVARRGSTLGAISVDRSRSNSLSLAEGRLLDDLAAQAVLVIEHLGLADIVARQRRAGYLDGFSPREHEVLELMARGRSNAAICQELHLSIKTVEPIVSTIFTKLGLHPDAGSNRRVLAVLAYLRA